VNSGEDGELSKIAQKALNKTKISHNKKAKNGKTNNYYKIANTNVMMQVNTCRLTVNTWLTKDNKKCKNLIRLLIDIATCVVVSIAVSK